MKRQDRFPETDTFHFYNANPRGRLTTDCYVRAICTALDKPYNLVVMEMADMQGKTGYDVSDTKLIDKYLKSKGWEKQTQPRKADGTKYTGAEFCEMVKHNRHEYPPQIIANIGGHHIVAIMFGQVYDTWDCTKKCIGNYWVFNPKSKYGS